jgi:hypothetical protein
VQQSVAAAPREGRHDRAHAGRSPSSRCSR